MRVVIEKNIESSTASFSVIELKEPHFDPNWHFHPHYQIFTVLEGVGTRLIGDSIQHFEPGDTVFLGPDLPHLWRSDKAYFEPYSQLFTHGIVIYFTEDFLGEGFFQKSEMFSLKSLLHKSMRGIQYKNEVKEHLIGEIKILTRLKGFEKVLRFLNLLHYLSHADDFDYITGVNYTNTHKVSETERMQKVNEYVLKHFREEIRLSEISDMVNMSESAFCRYFKNRTNKTFSEFVSEIRIGNVCKILSKEKVTVSQACYESGFNTLSNFNKQFREITGKTPRDYQKEFFTIRKV
ncbi:helix-turn-helix domain-containing protein [Emticicia sp. CRIBPO]|uniref:AraC family transcriptional regulator n=1 Tax=Emticicia sp. CRIBPO TaxID=2683258 RepID=UPI0014128FD0|nr:AraC family transcriptional regulator [Emticicia sp. CRIBPO]NBA86312.1 helix-turn-helix domain-containing protein [Emticicia sp. CRIBPO]